MKQIMAYVFTDRKTKKKYSEHKLALILHMEGVDISHRNIVGVAIMIDDDDEKQYFILDDRGHYIWVSRDRFKISETI